ncbi:MAG: lipooligosaccharide transport system ATP-binding protein [Gaiellales bacterium]|nr:lipooligosaccharide transport system ATP-binding protein [Gaiellales bacterium]
MSAGAPLIHARGLVKQFDSLTAVDGIDFDVQRGEAFGFLGPNGAGKSSTMRMVSAISPITGGTLRVLGMDPVRQGPQIRARIGVVPQDDCLDRELTVRENLFIYGRYFGLKRPVIRERLAGLLEFAQLQDKAEDQVETLSGGMRRRLTIARALINEPEILLLDEPTTGLDPQARHVLWDRLFRLKQNGVTLILTTHYMDEAEQLCDRLVVLDRGKIVAHGSPRDLIDAHVTREVLELRFPVGEQESSARTIRNGTFRSGASIGARVEALPDRVVVYADDGEAALAAIHATSLSPLTALVRRASLEDVFLELTGRSLIE